MANPTTFAAQYDSDVAIIGMSGRFPGANTIEAFWQNLRNGVEAVTFFSDQELAQAGLNPAWLNDPNYVKAGFGLTDIEMFDAGFFGFTPREAQWMDPQQRLFLECAWEALENAGYNPNLYQGRIGVYAGADKNTYELFNLYSNFDLLAEIGGFQALLLNEKDYLSTRVSYKLNLTGPSLTVQTACSTSLVATHLAWQSLLNGECDMALVGGACVTVPQRQGYFYQPGMILSPDGHCRAFDAKAQGTVFGSGVGIVVLKRMVDAWHDGDFIYAVIKGSAINNDGAAKIGYTAPSENGQAEVISEALALAQVEPETVTYVETHGTGTTLGDPIEMAALNQAFRTGSDKKGFCAIGSVKTNVGHLSTAAGVAGLIKTALALKHRQIPASLHFETPNPKLDLANTPFYVNTSLVNWPEGQTPRRAGVSSFGVGGTNAHVILEEAPALEPSGESRPWQLLVLSAKTATALETASTNLVNHLQQHPEQKLADIAYTLQMGRLPFNHRRVLVCRSSEEAGSHLESRNPARVLTRFQEPSHRPVAFMFSGQGSQYPNMGLELYQTEPIFRQHVDYCSEWLQPHLGFDLRQALYPKDEGVDAGSHPLQQTQITQPALFVMEYALAKLWMAWGIYPQAMIGHSIGEYVAACLAQVFSLEDALALVAARGQLMQNLPTGAMLAVSLPTPQIHPWLNEQLSLAAINGPSLGVVAGPTPAIEDLQARLEEQGIGCRRLQTSHAFHSAMLDPILAEFSQCVKALKPKPPQTPFISNVTGTWITEAEATEPTYWARHLRQTVRFAAGVKLLWQEPARLLLEIGPGHTLSTLASQQIKHPETQAVFSSLPHPGDHQPAVEFLLNSLGKLWLTGVTIDWAAFYASERRHHLPLPTYPFERQRYWIEPKTNMMNFNQRSHPLDPVQAPAEAVATQSPPLPVQRPNLSNTYVAPRNELEQTIAAIWQNLLGTEQIGIYDNFFELGGHSLLATQLATRLHETFPVELPLEKIFEMHTIAQLTELVAEKLIEKLEGMSEEEAKIQL